MFNAKSDKSRNVDTVADFSVTDDTIYLENKIFTKLTTTKTLSSKLFYASTVGKAHDKDDRIIYDSKKGYLYYDADGTGHGSAVLFAKLSKNLKMTYKDFYVI